MIRVALVDSGVAARHASRVGAARAFRLARGCAREGATEATAVATHDGLQAVTLGAPGHGPTLADALLADARVELVVARVFGDDLVTSAAQLAAALAWSAEQGARIANVSAGLREDRAVLGRTVASVLAQGVIVVAASPARGAPVYPASYAGVVRATGDARCAPGEWSWLGSSPAEFGAHVRVGQVRGASAGAAHVSALLAGLLADGFAPAQALAALRDRAHYRGPERH